MHHGQRLDGHLGAQELDHALDGPRAGPHAVDRLDLAIGDEEQRLEVQHRPDHRLRPADAPSHLDVAQRVEQSEDTRLRDPSLDLGGRLFERGAFSGNSAEKRDGHRNGLAVDHVDGKSLDRGRANPGGFRGRRELLADVDRDAPFVVTRKTAVDLGELPRRWRRGGGQRARCGQPREELLVGDIDSVAKRFLAEEDFERHDLDVVATAPLVGQVGSRVRDDRERPLHLVVVIRRRG